MNSSRDRTARLPQRTSPSSTDRPRYRPQTDVWGRNVFWEIMLCRPAGALVLVYLCGNSELRFPKVSPSP